MAFKGTSLPWAIDGDTGTLYGTTPADNGQQDIAKLLHDFTDEDDARRGCADALAMKFGPEMFEMLEKLLNRWNYGWAGVKPDATWDDVEALLARVRGEVV